MVFFFMEEGPRKANIHQCYDVTWACPTLSLKCLGTFSLMDISSPRHHLLPTNRSLHCPFFPITTPMSSSLLSHKTELQVDHELNWPSSEWLLSRTHSGKIVWVSLVSWVKTHTIVIFVHQGSIPWGASTFLTLI